MVSLLLLKLITLREVVAVCMALQDAMVQYHTQTKKNILLLHLDNMAVFHIVSNMVSAFPELVSELRLLLQILLKMKVTIRASWLPSDLNKHADIFSRSLNPCDLAATPLLLQSEATSLELKTVRRYWPLGEAPEERRKIITAQFAEFCRDSKSLLLNPPPPWIWGTVQKIKADNAHGVMVVPYWKGAPWFSSLEGISIGIRITDPGNYPLFSSTQANPAWSLMLAEVGKPPVRRSRPVLHPSYLEVQQRKLQ